jgi:PASTA domain
VHGRSWVVLVSLVAAMACALPAAASADPMSVGVYDVSLNGGSVQIGSFLPSVPLPTAGPLPLELANTQKIQLSLPSIANIPGTINGSFGGGTGTITGSYTIFVPSATLNVDPATGGATLDVSLYASFSVSATILGSTTSASCTLASAGSPVNLHLTTDAGAPWSATTGNFGLADKTFTIPAPSCDTGSVGSILALLLGGTNVGDNIAQVTGSALRHPDVTTPATTTTSPQTTGGSTTAPTTTPTGSQPPSTSKTLSCVVPKLKGKTLKQIKRSLKKAHCRLGKVKRIKSKQKKGTLVKQKTRAGKRLPAGTKIPVTLSRGRH